jgi:hypothetical protein
MWGHLPETSGKIVDPWETFMNSMSDVFSSYVTPTATYRPISASTTHYNANDSISHPDLVKWSGLKFVHPKFLQDLQLAFVCGIGFEQSALLVTKNHDVFFVGKNIHGSLGTGMVSEFETRLPIKNIALSGKDICWVSFGLDKLGGVMCLFALTTEGHIYSWGN